MLACQNHPGGSRFLNHRDIDEKSVFSRVHLDMNSVLFEQKPCGLQGPGICLLETSQAQRMVCKMCSDGQSPQ